MSEFAASTGSDGWQVILDARAIPSVDITAAKQVREFVTRLRSRGIEVVVAEAHLPLREAVSAVSGTVFNERRHFSKLADAVAAFQKSSEKSQ
jgi:MFS superfamily sulfate permease-like transporter